MTKISAIILTKNAEAVIADCIDSVSFCDEVMVIDDNSLDRTVAIAKMLKATVYSYVNESFAKKRNLGFKKAKGKWMLYIDADERLSTDLIAAIQKIIDSRRNEYVAYRLQRKNFYLGNHEWPQIEKLERLFKKSAFVEWYGNLHESPRVEGEIGDITTGYIKHYTHQDVGTMLDKTIQWSKIEAQLRFDAHHPPMTWWRFPRVMATAFYDSYVKQQGYKAGTAGLIESMYQAFSMFVTYARLWELQQKK